MKFNKFLLLIGGLGVGLVLGGLILWIGSPRADSSQFPRVPLPKIGDALPAFELPDLDEKKTSSRDYFGKPMVINFWATWCAPCKLEMPLLQKTAQDHQGELSLIAVNFEESRDTVIQFIKSNNLDLPVLLDESGGMANSFGIHAFPVTYFVDKDGIIRSMHIGQLNELLITDYLKTVGINQ
jgi:cytochrome c biogenesis protein CcmG/thiol:disulfide interchange protein DsbE